MAEGNELAKKHKHIMIGIGVGSVIVGFLAGYFAHDPIKEFFADKPSKKDEKPKGAKTT